MTAVNVPPELRALFDKAQASVDAFFKKTHVKPERGSVVIDGERFLMLRSASMAYDLFDCVSGFFKDRGEELAMQMARKFLFDIAYRMGKKDAAFFRETLALQQPMDLLAAGPVHFAYMGWAFVDISANSDFSDPENLYVEYGHRFSYEAFSWRATGHDTELPVCIMSSGYSAGWTSECFGIKLLAAELRCCAKGDDVCSFVMASPDQIEARVQAFIKQLPPDEQANIRYQIPSVSHFTTMEERYNALKVELEETERKFKALSASTQDAIILMGPRGEIQFWNDAATNLLGYERDDVIGTNMHELLAPAQYRTGYLKGLAHFFETGEGAAINKTLELEAVTKDCRIIPIELSVSAVNLRGEWHAVGIMRDIIDRKKNEARLMLSQEVIHSANEAIMITDSQNRIVEVNPAFTAITGYSQQEVLGEYPSMLSSGKHDSAFYQGMWHQLLTTGYWTGEIWNQRKDGSVYPEWLSITTIRGQDDKVDNYIGIFNDISSRKMREQQTKHHANYDALTNLLNRRAFMERLQVSLSMSAKQSKRFALLFLDLDHFKEVNDTMGHQMGDELLRQVAHRLRGCVRKSDTLSRFGGDEFAVLLFDIPGLDLVEKVARKILEVLGNSYTLTNGEARVTASIGISVYPDDAMTEEALLQHSDEAMYAVKNSTRNNFKHWTE